MLVKEGGFSTVWFSLPTISAVLAVIDSFFMQLNVHLNFWWFLPIYFASLTVYLKLRHVGLFYEVGIRSVFLGSTFTFGVFIALYSSVEWKLFGLYMCVMSFFHFSEFVAIAWCNPKSLSITSFVLNHSTHYNIAAVVSWLEFAIEVYLLPDLKRFPKISFVGLVLCVFGEALRKCAMITGSTNFNHIVQTEKVEGHKLVTHGVYALCRHPSYVGWFYWSIGTQVLLLNPICIVGYAIVSWRFFRDRINHEEHTLLYFFGKEYMDYQKAVKSGLPGIKGFLLDD